MTLYHIGTYSIVCQALFDSQSNKNDFFFSSFRQLDAFTWSCVEMERSCVGSSPLQFVLSANSDEFTVDPVGL